MRYLYLWIALFGLHFPLSPLLASAQRDDLERVFDHELGVVEKSGHNDGERILEYLSVTGLPEGYPWCAAFVAWCHLQVKIKAPTSAYSPDWFKSNVIWKQGKGTTPQKGDVFGIYFDSLGRVAHVGFVRKWDKGMLLTVEGNSNPEGGRDGYGVFQRRRLTSQIHVVSSYVKEIQ